MSRLTTPVSSAADPTTRARWAVGTALGILHPSAVPLRNGRVWLTGRDDMLPAQVMRGLQELLTRRAADRAADDRLLAEAIGVLGAEVARARGQLPARGAIDAIDQYLRGPGLDRSKRAEAEAMLEVALSSAAPDDEVAAARLDRLSGTARVVAPSTIASTSSRISQDAHLLGVNGPVNGPPVVPAGSRHRAAVGSGHRRAEGRRVWTSQVRGTGLVTGADGRPSSQTPLTGAAALTVLAAMDDVDLAASSVTDPPAVDLQAQRAVLQTTATDVPQHVRVEIGQTTLGAMAQGIIRSGTAEDPHVLRISAQLADEQLRHVWTHQLALMTQEIAAARADRPRGVLGRLKSVFSHERRDRRLHADHAAYQIMARDWQQARAETLANGAPTGPRSLADLERDLTGLSHTIRRHGGSEPVLPWAAEAIAGPDATAFGVAAARAQAEATPARNSVAHLRQEVVTQLESLQAAARELKSQSATKADSERAARELAGKTELEAATEEQGLDLGAAERARMLRVTAAAAGNKADRHKEIGAAYGAAAAEAEHAVEAYRTLLDGIDAGGSPAQLRALADAARSQVTKYEQSCKSALPVADVLMTGTPEGAPLHLPVDVINEELAANGAARQLPLTGPLPLESAEYRLLLSQDGMVFTVPGDGDGSVSEMPEVRLRMRARDIREKPHRDFDMAEQMSGTLGEGGISASTTNTHSGSTTVGVNLQPIMALAAPGTPLHAAAQLTTPKVQVTHGHTLADNAGETGHHQLGWVSVHRGESLLVEWDGVLEVEVRKSPLEPWSPVRSVDVGPQQTWVASPYTVKAQSETVTLAKLGHAQDVTGEFPRFTMDSVDGLRGIATDVIRQAHERYGDLDEVTASQISGLIVMDTPRLMHEMSRPGGLTRSFRSADNNDYELTWELEPDWSAAELVGEFSAEMGMEKVPVGFLGGNASQTYGASLTGTGSLSFPGVRDAAHPVAAATALNNVGGSGVNLSPSVSVGRNVSRQGGQNVSNTTISPVVHRFMGTQGVKVPLRAKATLRRVGDRKPPIVVENPCTAHMRVAENDLLRAGGRADAKAVRRDKDKAIRTDKDGRLLLRDDPEPPTGPQTAPPWMGRGPNQIRGVGQGLVQKIVGAEDACQEALAGLRAEGLVPRDGEPATRSQLANRDRVVQAISAARLSAGMNEACQSGLIVVLEDQGFAGTPRWRPYRLTVDQEYDEQTGTFISEGRGTSTNENDVPLGISSEASSRTIGQSSSIPVSAGVDGSLGPAKGVRGWAAKLGVKFSRSAFMRNMSWTAGLRINRVTLSEGTEPQDRVRQNIRIKFAEITEHGDAEALADVRGSMEIAYSSSLARAATPVFEQDPKAPSSEAVEQAIPVAVDAGNAADVVAAAIPAIRADSTALPALYGALAPSSLIANREWMNGTYKPPFMVVQAPGSPIHALQDGTILPQQYQVHIRGEAISLTHVAMTQQNSVDINFTMSDVGYTSGTATSGGISGKAGGGPVAADGSAYSGDLSLGRTGGTSQSTTVSETSGEERLLINAGTHHQFLEQYRMFADIVHNGQVVGTVPLPGATVQKLMAERRALELYAAGKLDLPLPMVSDAAERYLNDKLPLSPRVRGGFIRRYTLEKQGVTTGLAPTHTTDRFAAKLREAGLAAADQHQTEDERLTATLDQSDEMAARGRTMHTSEAYQDSLGSAEVEKLVVVSGDETRPADLRPQVAAQMDEVAPGLRNASPVVQAALDIALAPANISGQLDDMLSPDGVEIPIEAPLDGRAHPDVLLVRVRAHFEGDVTVRAVLTDADGKMLTDEHGRPKLAAEQAGGAEQEYDYETRDRSVTRTRTITVGADGGVPAVGTVSPTGSVSTDLTTTDTQGDGHQNTNLRRHGMFVRNLAERKVVFTTEVVRLHHAGAATMNSTGAKLRRLDPDTAVTTSAPRQLTADLFMMMPEGELRDGPAPETAEVAEQRPDHRVVRLPEGATPVRSVPFGRGEKKQDQLYDNLSAVLRRPEFLGRRGMATFRHLVRSTLKPSALKAKIGRLLDGGIALPPMKQPGNGKSMINVTVNAVPVGWELSGDPSSGQEGHVWRSQRVARAGSSHTRMTPLTATGGLDAGVASISGSVGDQVNEQTADAKGTRFELSRFLEGQMVTVRIPVVYDATIRTSTDNGRGEQVTKKTTHVPNLANGQMFVRMLGHRYLEGLRQLEQGAALDSVLADSRLQAVPEKLGRPDLVATEYGQGKSGTEYQPYRPLLDAIDRAQSTQKPVVLLVKEADGTERKYQALPGDPARNKPATLLGVNDGGFASAFATLNPQLARMAEGRVDLRGLYNTSSPDGSFSAKVAAELEKAGVPRDVLKALDYTTAARTMKPASPAEARHTASRGSGRTIAPTGHGPTMSGPGGQ
ncbi:hypothetical protein OHA18_33530 [Kribbella sp. NBC_00709]|uniref:hypothetical protein n=1 Tax=Kribbella sp. NBC_00709 TaxID=2975972 RepID=UPI002E28EC08|nr:hypothetical protein [Kribbella sp. NBC_00709]